MHVVVLKGVNHLIAVKTTLKLLYLISSMVYESVVVVFASIRVKPYAELLKSNRKLI